MRLEDKKKYDIIYCQSEKKINGPAFGQECFKCKSKNQFSKSKICKVKRKEQDINKCFRTEREIISKVHANLRLNGKSIKFMLYSGANVKVIPAKFVKDNKMDSFLKKGKKLDISVCERKKVRNEGTMWVELINSDNKRKVITSLMIVNEKVQPILSCNLC